eukprot:1296885-Rhodomonas_salina.1
MSKPLTLSEHLDQLHFHTPILPPESHQHKQAAKTDGTTSPAYSPSHVKGQSFLMSSLPPLQRLWRGVPVRLVGREFTGKWQVSPECDRRAAFIKLLFQFFDTPLYTYLAWSERQQDITRAS